MTCSPTSIAVSPSVLNLPRDEKELKSVLMPLGRSDVKDRACALLALVAIKASLDPDLKERKNALTLSACSLNEEIKDKDLKVLTNAKIVFLSQNYQFNGSNDELRHMALKVLNTQYSNNY